jgi:hypothetical protein
VRLSTARPGGTANVTATAFSPPWPFHGRVGHAASGSGGRRWRVGKQYQTSVMHKALSKGKNISFSGWHLSVGTPSGLVPLQGRKVVLETRHSIWLDAHVDG